MELELTSDQEFFAETTRKFLEDKADVTTLRGLRHDDRGYEPGYWRQGVSWGGRRSSSPRMTAAGASAARGSRTSCSSRTSSVVTRHRDR